VETLSAGGGLRAAHLLGGDCARGQTRITHGDFNFDAPVAAHAGTHGQGQPAEQELEMRNLQPLCGQHDFPPRREPSRDDALAERGLRLDGVENEDRALNYEI
jgi:hypothetical protein